MLKHMSIAALAVIAMVGVTTAQQADRIPMHSEVYWPFKQMARASTIELPIVDAAESSAGDIAGPDLLSAIVAWLSVIYDLPPIYDHPRVERASRRHAAFALSRLDYGHGKETRFAARALASSRCETGP